MRVKTRKPDCGVQIWLYHILAAWPHRATSPLGPGVPTWKSGQNRRYFPRRTAGMPDEFLRSEQLRQCLCALRFWKTWLFLPPWPPVLDFPPTPKGFTCLPVCPQKLTCAWNAFLSCPPGKLSFTLFDCHPLCEAFPKSPDVRLSPLPPTGVHSDPLWLLLPLLMINRTTDITLPRT